MLGVVWACIQARVYLQAIAASYLPPCTTLRQNVCVAAMLSDLLLLFLVDLVVSRGGNLCPQALSHAWVILIDSANLVLCTRTAHRRGSDTVRSGHAMLAALCIHHSRSVIMMGGWLALRVDSLFLNRVKALLALHLQPCLNLLRLLHLIDTLYRARQKWRSVTSLDVIRLSPATCVQLRLDHQVGLFWV